MNENGNVMRPIVGALTFAIGMIVLMVLWSPLLGILLPLLENAETIAFGPVLQGIIIIIPAIVIFSGIVLIVSSIYGGDEQRY